jgi:hypothetical protein
MSEKFGSENLEPVEEKPQPENREKRADVLLRFLNIAEKIQPFKGKKFEEIFDTEEHKREFIENLNDQEFTEILNGVNGILRNKDKEEWETDGSQVGLKSAFMGVGYVAPKQEDKPELLRETLSAMKKMNSEDRDLKDIGLLASSALNAIHPYADGNGRTSRLMYSLLVKDLNAETKEELKEVLLDRGRDKIDIDPGSIQAKIELLVKDEIGITSQEVNPTNLQNILYRGEISEKIKKLAETNNNIASFLEKLKIDYGYLFFAVFEFLKNTPDLEKQKFVKKNPKWSSVLAKDFLEDLSEEQLGEILENYRQLKKKHVEKLIDCIANPNKEEYQTEWEGQKVSLKDYFEKKMQWKKDLWAKE